MARGLFEGWHLPILILAVVLLFGGKRLPDAARGLGRSLRIFKAEVKQMNEEDAPASQTPTAQTPASPPRPPEPLEGRIMPDEPNRASAPTPQQRRDA
jgi:sec-independent protein translocase protein TatA